MTEPRTQDRNTGLIVLGMHRSGTSALAGTLQILGVELGERLLPAHACNPKGMWEHEDVVRLDETLLERLNLTWYVPSPLPSDWTARPSLAPLQDAMREVLARDFTHQSLWALKDPRLSRLLAFWKPVFQDLGSRCAYVFMLRDPYEIAQSLYVRDLFPADRSLLLWLYYSLEAERETRGAERLAVRFDDLLADWAGVVQQIASAFQLTWPKEPEAVRPAIEAHISPALRHGGGEESRRAAAEAIRAWVDTVYRHLPEALAGDVSAMERLDRVRDAMQEYTIARQAVLAEQQARLADIVIPVYRGLAATRRCIESVFAAQDLAQKAEVVVIDDASPEPELAAYLNGLAESGAITLIRNETNQGFVRTVNRGMALHPDRDVVLLNSDTQVAGDWLTRLHRCAYADVWIGTITPFSNNATICSYPHFCAENDLPAGYSVADLDGAFRRANAGRLLDIPTGVGFCLYIRRDCLTDLGPFDTEHFGAGYGEENDFCMRAFKAGWRNVLCADTFVYHEGSVSFGATRSSHQEKGLEALKKLHPDYQDRVSDFIARDPVASLRAEVDAVRAAAGLEQARQVMAERAQEATPRQAELKALRESLSRAESFVRAREAEIEQLRSALHQAEGFVKARMADVEALRGHNERLKEHNAHLEALLSEAREAAKQRDQALTEARGFVREREADVAKLQAAIEKIQEQAARQREELQQALDEHRSALAHAEEIVRQREAALEQLQAQADALRQELALIHNSRVWRYTKILRRSSQ